MTQAGKVTSFVAMLLLGAIATVGSYHRLMPASGTDVPGIPAEGAGIAGAASANTQALGGDTSAAPSGSLTGTWIKERAEKEGGSLPGGGKWLLSVTFREDGRFVWDSKRYGDEDILADESLRGTYSIERGFLIDYIFGDLSPQARQAVPEVFAWWPNKSLGRHTFRVRGDRLILGHDGAKLWMYMTRADGRE